MKDFAKERKGQFKCLGENTERGKINDKKLSYRLKLINSARFMPDSLSNLVYKLAEEFNINWFNDCIDKLLECIWEENGERNTKIVNAIWNM